MTTIASPSSYQQAIFDAVKSSTRPLVVEATAGSGKTSTIAARFIAACKAAPFKLDWIELTRGKQLARREILVDMGEAID